MRTVTKCLYWLGIVFLIAAIVTYHYVVAKFVETSMEILQNPEIVDPFYQIATEIEPYVAVTWIAMGLALAYVAIALSLPTVFRRYSRVALQSSRSSSISFSMVYGACLVFGVFGIHRFVVGRWGTGLLWLVTGGLVGIGAGVDLLRLGMGRFTDVDDKSIRMKPDLSIAYIYR